MAQRVCVVTQKAVIGDQFASDQFGRWRIVATICTSNLRFPVGAITQCGALTDH